jgi:hypothetical protein
MMTSRISGIIIAAFLSFPAAGFQAAEQKTFKTPDAAAQALIAAAKKGAHEQVVAILGKEVSEALTTGNPAQDHIERAVLFELADESTKAKPDEQQPDRAIVYLGNDEWPFPVPLVQTGSLWRFDGKAGMQEIEDRAIGRNELGAITACETYVDAQLEYAEQDRTGEGILQFAQKIRSSPGKHDGLFWSNDKGDDPSPLGPFVAESAALESGAEDKPAPFFGYYYRILTAQGDSALGGSRNFLVDGHLLGGFGLIAWPAEYGTTGTSTFIVNQLGQVYEKNLGPDTNEGVKAITKFDPSNGWKKVE